MLGFAVPFTSLSIPVEMLGQNHFAQPNWHVLTFLHPTFFCWATYQALVELHLHI
jgi:hypothetical protein